MFSVRTHAEQQFARYLDIFPEEAAGLTALAAQLQDPADIFVRSNMTGHITTSSLAYDHSTDMVLTVFHKLYRRELQPGGHQEGDGRLSDSANRETGEETGVTDAQLHRWHQQFDAPFDIDTHPIPAQSQKNEGEHLHHDFIYLFSADSTKPLTPQLSEVEVARWIPRTAFGALPGKRFQRLVAKLSRLIAAGFFD